jgi:hypothetical protein
MWCAVAPAQAKRLPSTKIGMITFRSGVCIAPMYGWFARNASPGRMRSPHALMIDRTTSDIAPSCAGM